MFRGVSQASRTTGAGVQLRRIFTLPTISFDVRLGVAPLYTPDQAALLREQHRTVVDALNAHVALEPRYENQPLEKVIKATHFDATQRAIYQFASQHWNMCFFMQCLQSYPNDGVSDATRSHAVSVLQKRFPNFKSIAQVQDEFNQAVASSFGGGWVWLTAGRDGHLRVLPTAGADTPLLVGHVPLLGLSVWEHAYLLDYRGNKAEYAAAFWKCANWQFMTTVLELLDPPAP